jgi:hypothetical protein
VKPVLWQYANSSRKGEDDFLPEDAESLWYDAGVPHDLTTRVKDPPLNGPGVRHWIFVKQPDPNFFELAVV